MDEKEIIVPFLKWAGGKRWLVSNYIDQFPKAFDRYVEPFVGSAAVFFFLRPTTAILSDINPELMNVYQAVKRRPDLVERYLRIHHIRHSKNYYYNMRGKIPLSSYSRAARTIYLNRTCWNALYRVNRQGIFNVPIGTKTNVLLPSDQFEEISKLLKHVTLLVADFERVIEESRKGDFVFVDPPYTVKHKLNGFIKYNETIFSWSDQLRLRDAIENAAIRGAKVLVTNADHHSLRRLYGDFKISTLQRASVIAANSDARGKFDELLIRCW